MIVFWIICVDAICIGMDIECCKQKAAEKLQFFLLVRLASFWRG